MSRDGGDLDGAFVQAGRLRLHHTFGGRGSPPVLFVHGLGSSGYIEWRFNLGPAAARHRVLAPDLPGFGRSAKPRLRYGVPLFVEALEAYVRALGLAGVSLVGTSMGGRVAIEYAVRNPGRVARLVLVNSLGLGRPRIRLHYPLFALPRVGEAAMRVMRDGLRRLPPDVIRRAAARAVGMTADPVSTLDDRYLDDLRELHEAEGYHEAYLATVRSLARPSSLTEAADLAARLAATGLPVLLVWGADDPLFPLEVAQRAHRRLAGSRLAIVERAGHTPQAERPDEFNRLLEQFLGG